MSPVAQAVIHLARKAGLLRLRQRRSDAVAADAGAQQVDGEVHPLARPLVGGELGEVARPTLNVR